MYILFCSAFVIKVIFICTNLMITHNHSPFTTHHSPLVIRYNQSMAPSLENTELVWIEKPEHLQSVASELAAEDILAVDTESNSLYAYQEQVCLLQFSTRSKDYLIDAVLLSDLSPLGPIFRSERILKVFHAAEYDLICLFRDFGFRFNFLFDTMIAARTLGYQKIGLGALLEQFFDITINKKYQRANWGRRPIKGDMLEYARQDSHYLIPLQKKLRRELEKTGRWELALEDFRRLTQGIEDTTESCAEDYWKLNGAYDLNPRQAAVLKSLYLFREAQAKAQDIPPFKVIRHKTLVEIAQTCPESFEMLKKCPYISQRIVERYGKGLIQAVQQGEKNSPEHPPHHPRPENAVLERMDALREWRKGYGHSLGVPSDVILPRDVLNRIAWENPQNLEELEGHMHDVPHRFNRFGADIIRILEKGEQSV
jgi:ribonuclease D